MLTTMIIVIDPYLDYTNDNTNTRYSCTSCESHRRIGR